MRESIQAEKSNETSTHRGSFCCRLELTPSVQKKKILSGSVYMLIIEVVVYGGANHKQSPCFLGVTAVPSGGNLLLHKHTLL
jgi:hypothetical protein